MSRHVRLTFQVGFVRVRVPIRYASKDADDRVCSHLPMPRPLSWLPRLHLIHRAVTASVRSHYGRRELENLFELQPRAAQKLLEAMPTLKVGTSRLVERDALLSFLTRVRDEPGGTGLLQRMRTAKPASPRRRMRSLIQRDREPVDVASLPTAIALSPGRLSIRFDTVESLAESLLMLARVLEDDTFAELYETRPATESDADVQNRADREDLRRLYAHLRPAPARP